MSMVGDVFAKETRQPPEAEENFDNNHCILLDDGLIVSQSTKSCLNWISENYMYRITSVIRLWPCIRCKIIWRFEISSLGNYATCSEWRIIFKYNSPYLWRSIRIALGTSKSFVVFHSHCGRTYQISIARQEKGYYFQLAENSKSESQRTTPTYSFCQPPWHGDPSHGRLNKKQYL